MAAARVDAQHCMLSSANEHGGRRGQRIHITSSANNHNDTKHEIHMLSPCSPSPFQTALLPSSQSTHRKPELPSNLKTSTQRRGHP